jgi:NAD(P)-dependent dehydrogenase (short-subunit alcohol dehydrogenase family)
MGKLDEKVAIVTGAARGLGRAFIIGATALQLYTVPNRSISVTSCKSAGSRVLALVSMGRPRPPPASATSTSIRPHSRTTRASLRQAARRVGG